jgi:hypothetical protein
VVLGALAAVGAVALVHRRYRRSVVEVELGRQIARERRCARELEALRGAGWTVLHSGVTAIPLGNHTSSATSRTAPSGVTTLTRRVGAPRRL